MYLRYNKIEKFFCFYIGLQRTPKKVRRNQKSDPSSGNNMRLNLINDISIEELTVHFEQVLNNRNILKNNKKDKIVVKQFS